MRPLWSLSLGARPRGLALAREKGWTLAWDEANWLHLLNQKGERQAQVRAPAALAAACCSDDGSAYAAVGTGGEVWWLAPDLMTRWDRSLSAQAVTAVLDPFGQYVAVADTRGKAHIFNRLGKTVCRIQSPRPLHHLAFIPAAPVLLGAAESGLVAGFDLTGRCLWRDGLVAHIGSLSVSGDGGQVALACFSEGILRYDRTGAKLARLTTAEACRLVSVSFDGRLLLVGGLASRLLLLDAGGKPVGSHRVETSVVGLALAPLGDAAVVALSDGPIVKLRLKQGESR
jgi:hypothetical protein